MLRFASAVVSRVGHSWCASFHPAPMWPINGHYICPKCQRQFRVLWEEREPVKAPARQEAGTLIHNLSPLLK